MKSINRSQKYPIIYYLYQDGIFPGLIPLVNSYLASMDVDADTHCTVQAYMKFIQKRASGELLTTAAWLRKEVVSHPEYKYVCHLVYICVCACGKCMKIFIIFLTLYYII